MLPTSMRYVALGTDAIVHSRVDLRIEPQVGSCERAELVAPAPSITALPAATEGAAQLSTWHTSGPRRGSPNWPQHETYSRGRGWVREAMVRVWDCNTVLHSIDFCCV